MKKNQKNDVCRPALGMDTLNNQRALSEHSELVRSPKVGVRPIFMSPDWASLALATFAGTKVARPPGRTPALPSTKTKPQPIEKIESVA